MVHDPQLIILDEPTNGLDPQGIADMRNLILHLSRHMNKTVIVSSHLLSEIELIATRMLIIDKGRKVVEGSVKELFDPSQAIVQVQTTSFSGALDYINQSKWKSFLVSPASDNLNFRIPRADIPGLVHDLVQAGIGIEAIQPKNSLENYFLHITAGKQYVGAFTD